MKKNIIIGFLSFLSVTLFIFSFYQKAEADKQTELAIQFKLLADQAREEARISRTEAEKQRAIASALMENTQREMAKLKEVMKK